LTENEIFAKWRESTGIEKEYQLSLLVESLTTHAEKLVWKTLQKDLPDLVAIAVWKAVSEADTFQGEALFTTWFHAIIRNVCNDWLREKQLRPTESLDENSEETFEIEDNLIAKLTLEKLQRELGEEEQKVLELMLQGYMNREIADILGIPLGSVHWKRKIIEEKAKEVFNG